VNTVPYPLKTGRKIEKLNLPVIVQVCFEYIHGQKILENLSFTVPPGKNYAIVGGKAFCSLFDFIRDCLSNWIAKPLIVLNSSKMFEKCAKKFVFDSFFFI
jgi:hypothetical protein